MANGRQISEEFKFVAFQLIKSKGEVIQEANALMLIRTRNE